MYCQAFGRWAEAEKKAALAGMIVKTKAGGLVQNPYLGIANRAGKQARELLVEFGMTPSSRTRVETTNHNASNDPKARFFPKLA